MPNLFQNELQVREALNSNGLGMVADDILALRRYGVGLASEPSADPVGWAWGNPVVPDDFEWPEFNGVFLNLVAQIDLARLPRIEGWESQPGSGYLLFFATAAYGAQSLEDARNSRVLFVPSDVEVAELEPPDGYEPPFCDPDEREDLRVTGTGWGLPNPNSAQIQALIAPATDYFGDGLNSVEQIHPWHLLFGFPEPWQGDPLAAVAEIHGEQASQWVSLLEIGGDAVGAHYFSIRKSDLAELNFTNVWYEWQCD
jgi:Domain of unknown function (DUF1963)